MFHFFHSECWEQMSRRLKNSAYVHINYVKAVNAISNKNTDDVSYGWRAQQRGSQALALRKTACFSTY